MVDWFARLQREERLISPDVGWPSKAELGEAIRRFRARGSTTFEGASTRSTPDPAGYLVDIELALSFGFVDHVYPSEGEPLRGERLEAMARWIALQARTYPQARWRSRLESLLATIGRRDSWTRDEFETALRSHGVGTAPPADRDWRWCAEASRGGRGGYPCALWLLFHATLANCEPRLAGAALETIAEWTHYFFGCAECAMHFGRMYRDEGGADAAAGRADAAGGAQISAVLWLWNAHNAVSRRLRELDESD